ncbi:DsbA family protein [Fundicoccus culcitae]|uniref:DsbA family protein n=1 Tax=Fundicoccus culcitae TaxID=2969821 RepID=A0ABY5P6E4_9LACT|nr:DsbA family protein [Fundicoccus culcitae]UUX34180.1 DsbA family protein [Fundicoccus culcitae]
MLTNYQIDYRTNGQPKMFEFYLFVNPLGRKSYFSEQEVNATIEMISSKVDLHIVCFHKQRIVTDYIKQLNLDLTDLNTRNHIYRIVYHASLAAKAASMQGKRKGRLFLMKMQQRIDNQIDRYNEDFIKQIAKEVGLDVDVFMEDINSDYVRELYINDQKIATSMNVQKTPSLVIFEPISSNIGYMIEDDLITREAVISQLDEIVAEEVESSHNRKKKHIRLL